MSDILIRLAQMKAHDQPAFAAAPPRQRYAVRLTSGAYAGHNRHWVSQATHALRFDFMTSAIAYAATALDLAVEEYTVAAI